MEAAKLIRNLEDLEVDFYTGVPDSLLKPFINYLHSRFGANNDLTRHVVAVNEGSAVAIAAGYHLSTGKTPCVYLQNSGIGNAVNPIISLLSHRVYGIPCVFVIGWRGEPGVKDEPQHILQGEITLELLDDMDVPYVVVDKNTNTDALASTLSDFKVSLSEGKSIALVIKKDSLTFDEEVKYANDHTMSREQVIQYISRAAHQDIVVSTTGKVSRELFEIRKKNEEHHSHDFLTVGSMGHCSSIALGIALQKKNTKVWCLDGDGSVLMHMGALANIGQLSPANYIHVVINNGAHESVGGMPTGALNVNMMKVAKACGYKEAFMIADESELEQTLTDIVHLTGPIFIEIKTTIGSRKDLGRPTLSPKQNKKAFMECLGEMN